MNRITKDQDLNISQHISNELIAALSDVAKFMGEEICITKTAQYPDGFPYIQSEYHVGWQPVQYNKSWDWLMPVIEKISKIEFHREMQDLGDGEIETIIYTHYPRTFGMLNNKTGKPMFRYMSGSLFEADTLIEAAFLATVDMIRGGLP